MGDGRGREEGSSLPRSKHQARHNVRDAAWSAESDTTRYGGEKGRSATSTTTSGRGEGQGHGESDRDPASQRAPREEGPGDETTPSAVRHRGTR